MKVVRVLYIYRSYCKIKTGVPLFGPLCRGKKVFLDWRSIVPSNVMQIGIHCLFPYYLDRIEYSAQAYLCWCCIFSLWCQLNYISVTCNERTGNSVDLWLTFSLCLWWNDEMKPGCLLSACTHLLKASCVLTFTYNVQVLKHYYRAMHFSAKRCIAIVCCQSVCLSLWRLGTVIT